MSTGEIATSSPAVATKGMTCAAVEIVQVRPRRCSVRAETRRRQGTPASSGSAPAAALTRPRSGGA
jgi:hypothetical protein